MRHLSLDGRGIQPTSTEPTHQNGHTLDLLITRQSEHPLSCVCVFDDLPSDHFSVVCNVHMGKPPTPKKEIVYRKLKSIDLGKFRHDISLSDLGQDLTDDLDECYKSYNKVLGSLLDQHAPQKKCTLKNRDKAPWLNDTILEARKKRRQTERKWRQTHLTVHRDIYKEQRLLVTSLIHEAKKEYYHNLVVEKHGDQKALFSVINNLRANRQENPLPAHEGSAQELAAEFSNFFSDKISKIHNDLISLQQQTAYESPTESLCIGVKPLSTFSQLSESEVKKIIMVSPSKSSQMDPIPTMLLKQCVETLNPAICHIVNLSLHTGHVPQEMKSAVITPLLKKTSLEPILKNYRPVSNLPFLSKVLERAVAAQLRKHLAENNLCDAFQSAYRTGHSTETALLRVHNDLLCATDRKELTILVLLDLSAAFDTVSHTILLKRLEHRVGLCGVALKWITSYLAQRSQSVSIKGHRSPSVPLLQGVPQGSVLGPMLFSVYTLPIGDIARRHKIQHHLYADDTQLYLSFKLGNGNEAVSKIASVIQDLRHWMAQNFLKLNDDKTEVLLIGTKQQCEKASLQDLAIGQSMITVGVKNSVRNLGAVFDSHLSMHQHVQTICKNAHYHLRQISEISHLLTKDATECMVHAFITSRLDYVNSLLYGLPSRQINRLQGIQNTAARIVSRTRKYDHITPVLQDLHWLPVRFRIEYKILLFVYKAMNDLGPSYLKEVLVPYKPQRTLRSGTQGLLKVPASNMVTVGDRAFSKAGPVLWNVLPSHIRDIKSLDAFKQSLKTHLFRLAYPSA